MKAKKVFYLNFSIPCFVADFVAMPQKFCNNLHFCLILPDCKILAEHLFKKWEELSSPLL